MERRTSSAVVALCLAIDPMGGQAFAVQPKPVVSQPSPDWNNPFYMRARAFAMDPNRLGPNSPYRVSTFLPMNTFVFPVPGAAAVLIANKLHQLVVVEDGETLLVPRQAISPQSFRQTKVTANAAIVFHDDNYMCDDATQKACGPDGGDEIIKNQYFSIKQKTDDYVEITRTTDEQDGYIDIDRYRYLVDHRVLTEVNSPHPKLLVGSIIPLEALDLDCGQKQTVVSENSLEADLHGEIGPGDFVKLLDKFVHLDVGIEVKATANHSVDIEKISGGEGMALRFFKIDLNPRRDAESGQQDSNKREFIVEANELCSGDDPAVIRNLTVKEIVDGGLSAHVEFKDFYPSGFQDDDKLAELDPAKKVFDLNNNQPYLTSITTANSFNRLKDIWWTKVHDIDLAEILMGAFNASCQDNGTKDSDNPITACGRVLEKPASAAADQAAP